MPCHRRKTWQPPDKRMVTRRRHPRDGGPMRVLSATAGLLVGWSAALAQPAAPASPGPETAKFAINREGSQIGTHTIELMRNGPETLVKLATHIEVKIAFITAYRFEQNGSERWVNSKLVTLK